MGSSVASLSVRSDLPFGFLARFVDNRSVVSARREMLSQYKLSDLGGSDFELSLRLAEVGRGHLGAGQLVWMAAKGRHLTASLAKTPPLRV